jgi:Tol biopolymer transport system component
MPRAGLLLSSLLALAALSVAAVAGGSPSSRPIVFSADRSPSLDGEVYRLDANGRRTDLSRSPFPDLSPVVAPRGRRVAFARTQSNRTAAFVVGLDGGTPFRVTPWKTLSGSFEELAWSPRGDELAVVQQSTLYVVRPGSRARAVLRREIMIDPSWSPDGSLVTVRTGGYPNTFTEVVHRTGGLAWRVRSSGGVASWSARGVLASGDGANVTLYAESGRRLRAFPARNAAWSPDGGRIASITRDRLQVHTLEGALALDRRLPGLTSESNGLAWVADRIVVGGLATGTGLVSVDLRTGKLTPARYTALQSSSVGGYTATTEPSRDRFAVLVDKDGRNRTFGRVPGCTDDGSFVAAVSPPQVVPGGQSVVYASSCLEPLANLYSVTPGGAIRRITDVRKQQADPALSPDGTQLVYTEAPATGLSCKGCPVSLRLADADGSHVRALTRRNEAWDSSPTWSPDGRTILFSYSTIASFGSLEAVPASGGPIAHLPIRGAQPSWGSARIAFLDETKAPTRVWTTAPDGSDRRRAVVSGNPFALASSGDDRLAVATGDAGHFGIDVLGPVGTHRLPFSFSNLCDVAWSPDGTELALAARRAGDAVCDVWIVPLGGGAMRRLTHDYDVHSLSWR